MASTLSMPNDTKVVGNHGTYLISKQLHRNVWRAVNQRTDQNVIVKSAPKPYLRDERDLLQRFQAVPSFRRFVDESEDPPLLILEYLESNTLIESGIKKFESSDVKRVARTVLEALAVLHDEGIVHTDIKPDNILVNHGENGNRFGDIKLADLGDSVHKDIITKEHVIGATIFRSPEAMLNQIWGTPTDIWSLGATLISLIFGDHWHIFSPYEMDVTDPLYPWEVMRRMDKYFGPFPLSYRTLVDEDTLETLTMIMNSVEKRLPFKMASSKDISREDRAFILRLMQLDPRDRPSAKELLQDPWLTDPPADVE